MCAAPDEEEGEDGAWSLQRKKEERKKHESFLELCSREQCVRGGWIFQTCKGFERSAPLFECDLKEMSS